MLSNTVMKVGTGLMTVMTFSSMLGNAKIHPRLVVNSLKKSVDLATDGCTIRLQNVAAVFMALVHVGHTHGMRRWLLV
jgi:hypothetical protein